MIFEYLVWYRLFNLLLHWYYIHMYMILEYIKST